MEQLHSMWKEDLDKIWLEEARIVTGATKFIFIHSLNKETGQETIEYRRNNHTLVMLNVLQNAS